ncbi:MAG: GlsB/YeaQ/YmgE family stress response membrane protein [Candidatus Limnocylindrales bacterium]
MLILAILVIAIVAGWAANVVVGKGKRYSTQELFFAGIIGSFVGGLIFSLIAGNGLDIAISGLIGSTIGAVVVLLIYAPIRQRMATANTSSGARKR